MKFITSPERINPLEFDLFVGLDVDKKSICVHTAGWEGFRKRFSMPYEPDRLVAYLGKHHPGWRIVCVYEAGPTGFGLYDALSQAGYPCLVVSPQFIPREPGNRVKTNRLDSETLATRLQGGELKGIRVPSPPYRKLRELSHFYIQNMYGIIRLKCQIKSLLLLNGIPFPSSAGHYTRAAMRQIEAGAADPVDRFILGRQLEALRWRLQLRLVIIREVERYCAGQPDLWESLELLSSLPGIGRVIRFMLLARLGDWRQLRNVNEAGHFLGLCPAEHSTGDRQRKGGITRSGDRCLRRLLTEACWTAITRDQELGAIYDRLRRSRPDNRGAKQAIVAVTRKLTVRISRVLMDRRPYEIRAAPEMPAR